MGVHDLDQASLRSALFTRLSSYDPLCYPYSLGSAPLGLNMSVLYAPTTESHQARRRSESYTPFMSSQGGLLFYVSTLFILSLLIACDDESTRGPLGGERVDMIGGEAVGGMIDIVEDLDDHTLGQVERVEDFIAHSFTSRGFSALKFFIGGFSQDDHPKLTRFLEGDFYKLHDEYYWFRLLNGVPVIGFDSVSPVDDLEFSDTSSVYSWARRLVTQDMTLPLDLKFTSSDRLYSPHFYEVALKKPRKVALGTVLYIPAEEGRARPEELWAFELEYSDRPSPEGIMELISLLEAHLPASITGQLHWLIRSPAQEETADELSAQGLLMEKRILRYTDLVVPGAVEVYSEGLTAGRVRLMPADSEVRPSPNDLLIYDYIPDDLPSCRGVVTSIPQTPLAHLNLLALNRGIPNVYVAGADIAPQVDQLAAIRAPAILSATAPDQWSLVSLTSTQYRDYQRLTSGEDRVLPTPDLEAHPLIYELDDLTFTQALSLRPVIGGKASGLLALKGIETPSGLTDLPSPALVVTARVYQQHLSRDRELISALLMDEDFREMLPARHLALEGPFSYSQRYTTSSNRALATRLRREGSSAMREVIERGGVRRMIQNTSIDSSVFDEIEERMLTVFGALSPDQGLRFRSSSNVEDIEGFNGAGLYASYTGFLFPHAQSTFRDQSRTLRWALKETWGSYWAIEAFEERRMERIDHLKGQMSVLVHPRFQDHAERHNGVLTLTLAPRAVDRADLETPERRAWVAEANINAQEGALSVTNPETPNALPEIIRVRLWPSEEIGRPADFEPVALSDLEIEIERIQPSTEVEEVLTDAEVRAMIEATYQAALSWRSVDQADLSRAKWGHTLTLDVEFRGVRSGWPQLRPEVGGHHPARVVLKQARPLSPRPDGLSNSLWTRSIPRDLLRRVSRIEEWTCAASGDGEASDLSLQFLQLYTNPLSAPPMRYAMSPFTAEVALTTGRAPDQLTQRRYTHMHYEVTPSPRGAPWSVSVTSRPDFNLSFKSLSADDSGLITWTTSDSEAGAGEHLIYMGSCRAEVLFSSPSEFLRSILDGASHDGQETDTSGAN